MITVVSPHLDDAVFGCGALLAAHPGAVVVTALAGGPPPSRDRVTSWDVACGFAAGDDVIAGRRAEDRESLALLGATPVWLDFWDAQYGRATSPSELGESLARTLPPGPGPVFLPLGLFHSDHLLTAAASLPLVRAFPGRRFFAYEEAFYRRIAGLREQALARLAAHDIAAEPADPADLDSSPRSLPRGLPLTSADCLERKRRAVHCYHSQLRGLTTPGRPGLEDAFAPERFWRLRPTHTPRAISGRARAGPEPDRPEPGSFNQ